MKGKLYGVSVGPGDPELLTIKAKRIIEECSLIAYPVRVRGERSVAFDIVKEAVNISDKRVSELVFGMSSDKTARAADYDEAKTKLMSALAEGDDVCMITLGDATVYSTFMRICKDIESRGFEMEIIPGVPSFCDGAAKAKIPLVTGGEGLAIVSASEGSDLFSTAIDDFDNVVIMKAHASMGKISDKVDSVGGADVYVVSNVGLEDQYVGPLEKNREYGYFTTVIVKKRRRAGA